MPKVGMKPVRRGQLIGATIATIGELGFADASVARIARRAGVSQGIVHHYFADKNALLEAAMRDILSQLRAAVTGKLQNASSPLERLDAIIDGNFSSEQFHTKTVAAWLAFWAQAIHTPALKRLQDLNVSRLRSNLRHEFRLFLPRDKAEEAAISLAALIDGLWLTAALSRRDNNAEQLARVAKSHARALISENSETTHA